MEVGIPCPPAAVQGRRRSAAAGSPPLSLSSEAGLRALLQPSPALCPRVGCPGGGLPRCPQCCAWARDWKGGRTVCTVSEEIGIEKNRDFFNNTFCD